MGEEAGVEIGGVYFGDLLSVRANLGLGVSIGSDELTFFLYCRGKKGERVTNQRR